MIKTGETNRTNNTPNKNFKNVQLIDNIMKKSILISGILLTVLLRLSAADAQSQNKEVPIPKPVTGMEDHFVQPGNADLKFNPGYHNTYQTLFGKNASVTYTTLPGIYTVYDLQSNGVAQQIWQDPLTPGNVHAVVMYSTVPGFSTRNSAYYFSSNYGATWTRLTDVTLGSIRSGFPTISGFNDGNAVIACHDNSQSLTYTNLYYSVMPGSGLLTMLNPGLPASQAPPIWPHVVALPDNTIFFVAAVNGMIESYTNKATNITPPGTFSGYQLYNGDQAGGYAVAVAPNGSVGHAYIGSDIADPYDVFFRSSANGGLTFSNPVKVWDWNINTDSLGCLRGVSIVFDNSNQPFVAFNTSKLTESEFYPAEPSQIRVWSPGINNGIPRIIADSSNVPFYPNTGLTSDAFLPLCRPSIGRSSSANSILVTFSATTQFKGIDSSRYYSVYISHSTDAGNSWYLPEKITPESPLRDWRFVSISPVSNQISNTLTAQMICQSDSVAGTHVNGAGIGRGEFVNIRYQASTSPAPAPPALLQPLNGAYVVFAPLLLDWGNVSNAQTYSVQLSSDSVFANLIVNASDLTESRYVVDTLLLNTSTQYFWRARATNSFGSSDWSDQWRFSTYQMMPLVPVLNSPPNGSINVSVTPLLDWTDVPNALTYSVQISREPTFLIPVYTSDYNPLSEFLVPSSVLNHDSTYFWRANGKNQFGIGAFSQPWSFTVISQLPAAPLLQSPANGSVVFTTTPSFAWSAVVGATSYRIQVSSDSSFGMTAINVSNITTTGYTAASGNLNSNTTYYWRISGFNANGYGPWSERWVFSTSTGAPPPVLLSPSNGQTGVLLSVVLDWSNSVNAINYDMTLATDSLFQNVIADARLLSNSSYSVQSPLLTYNTVYYWRARANSSSGSSDWSAAWRFRTVQIGMPSTPGLQIPSNGAVNVLLPGYFRWMASSYVSHYKLQVSVDSTFGTLTFGKDTILQVEYTLPDSTLDFNTNYFWRVQALNHIGTSNWSQVYKFKTATYGSGLPVAPLLVSPINNSNNVSAVALLNWSDAMLATGYQLNVATDVNFSNVILTSDTITLSQYKVQPGSLNNNTLYFWKVRSLNTIGESKWSDVFAFRTALLTQLTGSDVSLPEKFGLYGNYPNPFNPVTKLRFDVPYYSDVEIVVYDIGGRETSRVIDEAVQPGTYETTFDASRLPSGVYFCRMAAGDFSSVVRMVLLK